MARALLVIGLLLVTAGLLSAQSFEVASIRASQFQNGDGEGSGRESIETSGDRLTMRSVTIRSSIAWAYGVQDSQVAGDLSVDRFDIAAKAAGPATVAEMRAMLGTLLKERFKLALHRDSKELSTLDLVVAKGGPKLKSSQEGGPGVLRPGKGSMVAQHATMQEFVGTLSGPLRTPVVDKTGLTGRYDFTVDLNAYMGDAKAGDRPDLTAIIMTALREQVGLNLEARKERVEMLVIDHVEKRPEGN